MDIRGTFKTFRTTVQWALGASFVLGFVALAVFTCADVYNPKWWEQLSYLKNIAAGLTGFLIGVPIAAVVLDTVTEDREERLRREALNRLSARAWQRFSRAVLTLCDDDELTDAVDVHALGVHGELMRLFEQSREYRTRLIEQGTSEEDFSQLQAFARSQVSQIWSKSFRVRSGIGTNELLQKQWNNALAAWKVLDSYVRLQRMEHDDLEWFDPDLDSGITNKMSRQDHPLTEFCKLNGDDTDLPLGTRFGTPPDAITELDMKWESVCFEGGKLRFDRAITESLDAFWVPDYLKEALWAARFLYELRGAILAVNQADWPNCTTSGSVGSI